MLSFLPRLQFYELKEYLDVAGDILCAGFPWRRYTWRTHAQGVCSRLGGR